MKRRDFLKSTLLVAAGALMPASFNAFAGSGLEFPGIIYTPDNSGKWSAKVGGHMPNVALQGDEVNITTNHSMSQEHYIVRHTLVSKEGEVLGEKTFYPSDPEAVSTFQLPKGSGQKFYATSFCNKHDFWVAAFSV
tara:strand:+ start:535 stop:942 length:408 start_codon:yes stop_codon:yes gene_type:complete